MNKKYKSEAMMVIHQPARDLFDIGSIDAARMREFDEGCLIRTSKPAKSSRSAQEQGSIQAYTAKA